MLAVRSFLRFFVACFSPERRFKLVWWSIRRGWGAIPRSLRRFGRRAYKRATLMQAPLAVLSFLSGTGAWLLGGGIVWLFGAVLIGLVVPFTFIAIMPTNHRLLEPGRDLFSAETRSLLERWRRLHAVRSLLSFLASILYLISLLKV
ncbi:MAG TPA: DUF1772 domain-containing protein [Candidatus Binatia bacterium]